MKNLRLPLLLLVFSSFPAIAQKSLSLTTGHQQHLTSARFTDDRLASARVSILPAVYRNWLLGATVGLSPRYAVQATAGLTSFGLSFASQLDYRRIRGQGANTATSQQDALEYALVVRRYFVGASQEAGGHWFADVGVDVIDISPVPFDASLGFGTTNPGLAITPGVEGSATLTELNPYRLGLRFGAGREWPLATHHFLALQLVGSIGLRDLQRYDLTTVTWQQSRTIDPTHYHNRIATRFSFVGVQARYRFQL